MAAKKPIARRKRVITTKVRRTDEFANFIVADQTLFPRIGEDKEFGTIRVQTPLPRIKTSGNKATILEILWVDMVIPRLLENFDVSAFSEVRAQLSIGSAPVNTIKFFQDPTVFADFIVSKVFIIGTGTPQTETTSMIMLPVQPFRYELQTKDGAGYLLTVEAFNFSVETFRVSSGFNTDVAIKVWYRFVDVGINDFVGLVQSTQQS